MVAVPVSWGDTVTASYIIVLLVSGFIRRIDFSSLDNFLLFKIISLAHSLLTKLGLLELNQQR